MKKEILLKNIKNNIKNCKTIQQIGNIYKKYKQEIIELTIFLNYKNAELRERIYCIENNITKVPKCIICNNEVQFRQSHYNICCSISCSNRNKNNIKTRAKSRINNNNICNIELSKSELKNYIQNLVYKNGIKQEALQIITYNFKKLYFDKNLSIKEMIYIVNNNLNKIPVCIFCNGKIKFLKTYNKYPEHCTKCKSKYYASHQFHNKMIEKYGVKYPSQNPEISERQQKGSYKLKEYKLPSGKIIKIQGYENLALDELLKYYNESDIITSRELMPELFYNQNNKTRRYFPDIYIPKENLIIEVKSEYILNLKLEEFIFKQKCTIDKGFDFQLLIF